MINYYYMKNQLLSFLLALVSLSLNAQCSGNYLLNNQNGIFQDAVEIEFYTYKVFTSECDSICLNMNVSTNGLLWSGSVGLEVSQECNATNNPCPGDVNNPAIGDCIGCWDFLHANLSGATTLYENTLGDDINDATEANWSTGFIPMQEDSLLLEIRGSTSGPDEILSFSDLSLICYTERCGSIVGFNSCEDNIFFCENSDIGSYEGCLLENGSPIAGLCAGFVLNNPNYARFIAGSESISFSIELGDCNNGVGIQTAITDPCSSLTCYDDSGGACFETDFQITATNLIIGQTYQLVIDGCAGDACNYTISVTSGVIGDPLVSPSIGLSEVNGIQSTEHNYSVGDVITFYPEGMNDSNFTHCWDMMEVGAATATNTILDTPLFDCSGAYISEGGLGLEFNQPGNYILCLIRSSNGCDVLELQNFCYGVNITDVNLNTCSEGEITISRPENPNESPFGPFCPGETVTVCYDLDFSVDPVGEGNNCQWFQGIVPSFGGGWDMDQFDPISITDGAATWFEDDVVSYTGTSSLVSRLNNCDGEPTLSAITQLPSLAQGDLLPGGWYWTSPGAAGCENNGNPNSMWGLPAGCGTMVNVAFCIDVTTKTDVSSPCFSNHDVSFMVFSDGMTGCWANNNCGAALPDSFSSTQTLCDAQVVDNDGDGFDNTQDCNDDNPDINPGATEICDGLDNNCNGQIDEGFDTGTPPMVSCAQSTSSSVTFIWNADPLVDLYFIYIDGSFITETNDLSYTITGLEEGDDVSILLEAIFGNDCPSLSSTLVCAATAMQDADGDGYDTSVDCNESDPEINPGATEVCDGIDNNCDGQIDEGFTQLAAPVLVCATSTATSIAIEWDSQVGASEYEIIFEIPAGTFTVVTTDTDFFVDQLAEGDKITFTVTAISMDNCPTASSSICCTTSSIQDADGDGYDNTADCDDSNPDINPDAIEECDGVDNNCDGQIDEGFTLNTYYADVDGDDFGNANDTIDACITPPGYADNDQDCDDTNADVYPGAMELCDGLDNNCDGQIDEGLTFTMYFADSDEDGFGDPDNVFESCELTDGLVENDLDCDDTDPAINPDAEEINGNGIDEDCDGMDGSVAVKEVITLKANVYPNPSKDLVNIESNLSLDKYWLISTDGHKLQIARSENTIDISDLTNGLYFIQAQDIEGNIYWLGKIIKN